VRDPLDKPTKDVHRSHAQGMMLRGIDPLVNRDTAALPTARSSISR
jgi:hypothetical protein